TLSVREVWPELPRELADATQVLGGVHPSYDYSRATVEPADKTLRAGSLLIRPLQGPASASLVNGGARLVHSGHSNHWIGDSPGQAYYFNGRSHHVCAPNNRLEEVGLTDDFTLELWANPLLNYESAHIVHQRGQNSGYVLGLDPALIRAALQLNGTDEFVHAAIAPWYSKSFTLELWLKPSMAEQPSAPGLFSSTEVAGANDALSLILNADGTYQLQHATGSLTLGAAEPVWHHLAISYDGQTLRAYFDAQLVAEVEENDHTYGFQTYLLGTNVNRDTFFAGQFDELRLWSYARGLQALASERHTRMRGDEPGLHSYYRFDLTKALDLTGRAENGTYHGTPAVVTTHSALQGFRLVAGVARARGDAPKKTPETIAELQTRQFVRSREVLTQQQWNHLSMRFHQSYALQFNGQGGVKVSHNPALNLCDDLSIEVFAYLPRFTGNQTLISKGSPGMGDDQSLPFALQITGTGYLQALVEDPDGRVHTFAANQPLTPGFRRIALVRTGGSSRQTRSQSQTYSFTDSEGTEHNVPVDIVEGVDTDEWQDYVFYVDGVEFGRHRHHGEKPLGNTGPLTIGTAGLRQNLIGTLSEVRLWSVAREGKEYGRPIRGGERGLKAWWAFEEKRGNVAYERQGDYNGQLAHVRHVESPDPLGSTLDLRHNGLPLASEKLTEESPWMAAELWGDTQFTLGGQLDEGELQIGFTGSLEEVRLWRVQRTQEQIMDNLFDRIKEEKQELLAYYSFDEDSTVLGATHLQDNGLRGLHLVWPTAEARPRASLSDAPVSQDAPSVRSALAGVHTAFHQLIDGSVGVEEYGDLQSDAQGETFGVLKRAYAYIQDGHWTLFTGYKVGSLISEWIGQAQFDPQVVGFVEGSPPVPSENLTAGQMNPNTMNWADFGEMVSMEFVESDQVSYSLGSTTESSNSVAFDASVKANFDADFMISVAPFGFGSIFKALEVEGEVGVKGHFASQGGWSNEASLGTSLSRSRGLTVRMGGSWESPDTSEHLNPALGRRLIPSNVGFALVQSETADV
ncbi:MAG: LamG-like jellyroll fold domain-containing protein, partial [Nannocystaceae bacterium]